MSGHCELCGTERRAGCDCCVGHYGRAMAIWLVVTLVHLGAQLYENGAQEKNEKQEEVRQSEEGGSGGRRR